MATCDELDVWTWIVNLSPITKLQNSMSLCICSSKLSYPSLKLTLTKSLQHQNPTFFFSVSADFHVPITLWTSDTFMTKNKAPYSFDEHTLLLIFHNFIRGVLNYAPNKDTVHLKFHTTPISGKFRSMFNLAFLTLAFLVCIYEAPSDIRSPCLHTLRNHLTSMESRNGSKMLMRHLGSNLEELWMRSLNLAITNRIREAQTSYHSLKSPSPLFSYSLSTNGLWKVQLYCPTIAMDMESSSGTPDERLLLSLTYQQIEAVIQFSYRIIYRENWVDVIVAVDNIRCDVIPLAPETVMSERGAGVEEKHFPSRISLQVTPIIQTNIISVSVSKSSDNPTREIELEKTIEGSFDPPSSYLGLKVSVGETITMSMKPWKFEQWVYGSSANLNWFLHDSGNGREVFSSKPSKLALMQPKAWFKDRYSSAYRPFTKQGGVVFAGDEYGDRVWWKLDKETMGKTMEWEIKGMIWLTYYPNKYRTFYTETRRLEFREVLHLPLFTSSLIHIE